MNAGAQRAERVMRLLERAYPDARCALGYQTPLQLLIATILSAQCTDERVNLATPALFRKYPTAEAVSKARPAALERLIRSCGFYRQKAKALRAACRAIHERHGGEVPADLDALVRLEGVGRKTANVILNEVYGRPAIAVDTHVLRTSNRLGWADTRAPSKAERQIAAAVPERWHLKLTRLLIAHGRRCCSARKPDCPACPVRKDCLWEGKTAAGA